MTLAGRNAIITGASLGLGAEIAEQFAAAGASLMLCARNAAELEAQQKKLSAAHPRVRIFAHCADVSSESDVDELFAAAAGALGKLDILVNNAGITSDKTVLKMADDDWFKVLNVNLSGAFFLSQAALRHMAERGSGRIVNVSSVIGEMGNIGQANYAASKSGLFGLTKTLAREAAFLLARSGKLTDPNGVGLTVNTITPGFIATEVLEHIPDKVMEKLLSQIPLGRLGKTDEVARVVHFLAADASSYITGQVWAVNGGMDM
jgi:NAD(P)-dependent dehydrogenase (short-subunit alcohol dehydrogenase family)